MRHGACTPVLLRGSAASPGKIHAKEDDRTVDDLLDTKALSNDARGNPRDGDQVRRPAVGGTMPKLAKAIQEVAP